ncbi:MAG: hypothetical protein QNJ51_23575 [Calothrix sp. MO_167.B12]|nr:hypothetical protein [Calothrix sp. MO_167.B12]
MLTPWSQDTRFPHSRRFLDDMRSLVNGKCAIAKHSKASDHIIFLYLETCIAP